MLRQTQSSVRLSLWVPVIASLAILGSMNEILHATVGTPIPTLIFGSIAFAALGFWMARETKTVAMEASTMKRWFRSFAAFYIVFSLILTSIAIYLSAH